jgi:hypothetical protein
MRLALLSIAVVSACSGKSGTPDAPLVFDTPATFDATPVASDARIVDTTFTCTSSATGGDSCDGPLFDPSIQSSWSLQIMGDTITVTAIGFDTPTISCTGSWTGALFDCQAHWTRAGRMCDLMLHARQEANASITFWVGTVTDQTASCTPQ